MEKTIRVISILLGTTLVIFIRDQLNLYINFQILTIIISVIIAVLLMVGFEYLTLSLPKKLLLFRKFIYPLANFEGYWLQTFPENNDESYSCCKVEYNSRVDRYAFYGTHFDYLGNEQTTFNCEYICFEEKLNGFTYSVEGQIDATSEFMKCWGYACFDKELFSNKYTRAKGYFVNIGTNLEGHKFLMKKITKQMTKDHSNNSFPKSAAELKDFINKIDTNI